MNNVSERRVVHLWSLGEDVAVEPGAGVDTVTLRARSGDEHLVVDAFVREALRRMEHGPIRLVNVGRPDVPVDDGRVGDDERVVDDRRAVDGGRADGESAAYLALEPVLRQVSHLVVCSLGVDDLLGPLLSVRTRIRNVLFAPVAVEEKQLVRLTWGVRLSMETEGLVMECEDSDYQVVVHRPEAVWVVGMLIRPCTTGDAARTLPLPEGIARSVIGYLVAAGMAVPTEKRRRRI
ncbi:hypothetical protein OG897_36690 [Streptomyces sp. NBC_00237]|uniref:hypothetical protein n=1 Tax=Streptomyces sp. NBC_00237 TaxID=2975687 RepID=UPI0022576B95|nr:hypothetical protein [Streptomyces sp. NBC_00237]MCX5206926.1 hypothetical protein [Streptomyces sp. NBC_00237]